MNIAHMLLRTARRLPAVPAVIERDRTQIAYVELAASVLKLAAALRGPLAQPAGARVALVMKNNAAYVELLYACWATGLAAIPVNVKLHPREIAFILDDAGATVCFVTDDVDTVAIEAARAAPGTRFFDVDSGDYRKLHHTEPAGLCEVKPQDVAWLFYTSGTTGKPKGVMLTHANLLAATLNYLADVDHAAPGEHLLHVAPMSHGSGLYIVPNTAAGCTHLIPASRGFDVHEIDTLLAFATGTKFFAAPTMLMRLVDGMRGEAQTLKSIIYGGGPMYVSDALRALERLGPRLIQIYGQGESPMTITVLSAEEHVDNHDGQQLIRLASVGRAQTGVEIQVVDENDRVLPAGEVGEVCVRSDAVMLGYLNDPEATAKTLARGWLHTGDLGRLDKHGYLTLVDRSKDLVISGGSNIYPREVEEVLIRHPAVREIAVIGEPDREWGEALVAVVVLREGASADAAELEALCLEHLARFKRPKRYVFVEELPKNAAGKVLKRELRDGLVKQP
jgi:long-chain acyl-CoA synthetase